MPNAVAFAPHQGGQGLGLDASGLVGLREIGLSPPGWGASKGPHLVLLGALGELPELGVQLREAPCDLLDAGVQVTVLTVLSVEVILVALTLLGGGDGGVFSGDGREARGAQGLLCRDWGPTAAWPAPPGKGLT